MINDIQKEIFTVLLGKNGSGKSIALRTLDQKLQGSREYTVRYITPERGGSLKYEASIDEAISRNVNWLMESRRKNRFEQFRQQSAAQFRNLEILILREIEKDAEKRANNDYTFDTELLKINAILPAIEIRRTDRGFDIYDKKNATKIPIEAISSGESELVALVIEVLVFSRQSGPNKILLLDEPDVHLHPDLQQRFVQFLESAAIENNFKVVIATHSTAIIGAFNNKDNVQVVLMDLSKSEERSVFKVDEISERLLPIFGAHPLSEQFNNIPILLVEGDDDKRVFEQVARSSSGKYLFSPCAVDGVGELNKWEEWLDKYLPAIYDSPKGYSLRDLDNSPDSHITNLKIVVRARLNCYAIENVLLCDETLVRHNVTPEVIKERLEKWIEANPEHDRLADIQELVNGFENRRTIDIKRIRNIVVALLDTSAPWEVTVGQVIAEKASHSNSGLENSLATYLGPGVMREILGI